MLLGCGESLRMEVTSNCLEYFKLEYELSVNSPVQCLSTNMTLKHFISEKGKIITAFFFWNSDLNFSLPFPLLFPLPFFYRFWRQCYSVSQAGTEFNI